MGQEFLGALTRDDVNKGDNSLYGAGFVLATDNSGRFTWGREAWR